MYLGRLRHVGLNGFDGIVVDPFIRHRAVVEVSVKDCCDSQYGGYDGYDDEFIDMPALIVADITEVVFRGTGRFAVSQTLDIRFGFDDRTLFADGIVYRARTLRLPGLGVGRSICRAVCRGIILCSGGVFGAGCVLRL